MPYWYNWFSWWWAHSCSKHVEYRNKYMLTELYVKLVIYKKNTLHFLTNYWASFMTLIALLWGRGGVIRDILCASWGTLTLRLGVSVTRLALPLVDGFSSLDLHFTADNLWSVLLHCVRTFVFRVVVESSRQQLSCSCTSLLCISELAAFHICYGILHVYWCHLWIRGMPATITFNVPCLLFW